jgi:hypothetical protein
MKTAHRAASNAKREFLTSTLLRELLNYDPLTGKFTRLVRTSNRINVGDEAGSFNAKGYRQIYLGGFNYRANRLAWLYMTGEWPADVVDHINGNRSDDRWVNLRDVPGYVNQQNYKRARRDSSTGFLGVSASNGRYTARIRVAGKYLSLGSFSTPELAHLAYLTMKRKAHVGCTI